LQPNARHPRPRTVLLGIVALATIALPTVAASAAPPKVELCHANGAGKLIAISVSERAAERHLHRHDGDVLVGDGVDADCQPLTSDDAQPTPPADTPAPPIDTPDDTPDDTQAPPVDVPDDLPDHLLVRATGLGVDGGVVLVAGLVDVDRDGVPSVGDVVRTGAYPVEPGAAATGTFAVTEYVVDAVGTISGSEVRVSAGDAAFRWVDLPDGEQFTEANSGGFSGFGDAVGDGDVDAVLVQPASPSAPAAAVFVTRPGGEDDAWFDVTIG
jgi:hypothetical protein